MDETPAETKQREIREFEGKNVAHYSVLLQAWVETRMERDRTLVTLSGVGIGLLVTILTAVGVDHWWELLLYAGAVAGFLITIWSSLIIYQLNSQHIEQAIHGSSQRDPRLEKFDKTSLRAFVIGAAFSVTVGLASAINHLITDGGTEMAKDQEPQSGQTQNVKVQESVNGVGDMAPQKTERRSLDGITDLKPQAPQPVANPEQAPSHEGGTTSNPSDTQQQGQGQK